jgi:hypothetical protein
MSLASGWENFFVAEAGAAAPLNGLVFVAVSISLQRILDSQHLRARASETLRAFLAVLVPGQSCSMLGTQIAAIGLVVWAIAVVRHAHAHRDPDLDANARRWLWSASWAGKRAACRSSSPARSCSWATYVASFG